MNFVTITPARRRKLAVGDSLSEHGVKVTRLANGDERWSLVFMYHGTRVKRVLGLKSEGWNATKALAQRDIIRSDIREGVNALPKGRKTPIRFAELGRWYLQEMEETGGKNIERKRLQLDQRLMPKLGDVVVETLTEQQIARYASELIAGGLSPSTVNRDLATLSHVFSTAVRGRKLHRRPCGVPKMKEPEGRTVVLSDAECDALIDAAKADSHPYLWLFVEFGLRTAMRSAEIVSARFDLIDWDRSRLYLPKAKAGARMQPLSAGLVDLLRRERDTRQDRNGWVFPSAFTKSGHVNEFNGPFRRAVVAAGLSPELVTPHVMRHTATTNMVASGAPLAAVQRVTGHKTLAMVMKYTHLVDRNVDGAVAVLDRSPSTASAA